MRRLSVVLFLITFVFPQAAAAEMPLSAEQSRAREGLRMLLTRDYDGLEVFLKRLVSELPPEVPSEDPLAIFGRMATYQVRNLENFDFRFDPPFEPWQKKGREWALRLIEKGGTPWEELIAGGILGISGFYHAHNRRWLAGLRDSSRGIHTLEKVARRDPGLADALLGVGLYDYWRSHFTRYLRFLPFFPDRRVEGRRKLLQALSQASFVGPVADISIAFIDFQEKRYDEVLKRTKAFLVLYPRNVIVRTLQGETLYKLKRYPEAIREFDAILEIDRSLTKAHLFRGLIYAAEGKDLVRAQAELKAFLAAEPNAPAHWKKPAREKLKALQGDPS